MDMAYCIPRRKLIFASPRQLQLQFVCTPRTHEGAARFPASFYQVLCLSRYALFSTPHNCSTPTPSMANSLPLLHASSNVMTCGVWPRGSRHLSFPIRASVGSTFSKHFGWRRSRSRKYRTTTKLEDTIQLIDLFYPFTAVVARCIYLGNWECTLRLCCMNSVRSRGKQTCYPH